MRKLIRWYKMDNINRNISTGDKKKKKNADSNERKYSQKYMHYLLDKEGKLTDAKKKEILGEKEGDRLELLKKQEVLDPYRSFVLSERSGDQRDRMAGNVL